MAIKTRETTATGVTNKGAPLTNAELDNNFVEIVADIADKVSTADLNESVDDRVNGLLQAGLGVDLTYDDVNNELTIDSNHVEVNCTNNSGASIAIGTPVYQTGVSGNNITIAPADADDAAKMPAIGLTTSTIADTGEGTVVILGVVNGLDTSSFAAGDTLYVGTTAGSLTTTAPTGESGLIQNFGRVLKVNASSGAIAVMGAGRANAVPNLNDGNVFIGNASNQAETRALVEADISDLQAYLTAESDTLDSVTGRGNTTSNSITVGNATVTGDLTVQGTTTTLNTATLDVEDKNITINYSTGDSSGSADGAGITIQDAVNSTTDATILWDATGDKFEFSHAVDVAGNITLTGTVDGRDIATDGTKLDGIEASADVTDATNVAAAGAVMDGDFTSNGFMKRTGAGTYTVDTSTYLTSYTETDTLDSVTGRGATTSNAVTVGNLTSTGIDDNATSTAITIDSSQRVGINTATFDNAAQVLVVKGDASISTSDADNSGFNFTAVPDTTTGKVGIGFKTYNETASAVAALYATPVGQYRNSLTARYNADSSGGYFSIEQLVPESASVQERMRIDSSGNMGIGTTSPDSLFEVEGKVTVSTTGDSRKGSIYNSGGGLFIGSEGATGITDIVFNKYGGTEAMRINSSGNVGIGTTSPETLLMIEQAGTYTGVHNTAGLKIRNAAATTGVDNPYGAISLSKGTGSAGIAAIGDHATDADIVGLGFFVHASATGTAAATRAMTIDSSGNVGIGTASPNSLLDLRGTSTNQNVLQLSNSAGVSDGGADNQIRVTCNGDTNWGNLDIQAYHTIFTQNGTERMRLTSGGDLHVDGDVIAYSTTISDQRLKDDVETIDSALHKVSNLRGVTYTWNAGSREGQRDMGVIAQEVEAVIPEIVHEKEMALIDGETYKTVDYEKLTAVLIEAVKELKAEVDALKAAR